MENLASPNVAAAQNFDDLAPTKAGSSDFTALMEKALAEGGAAPPGAEPPAAASTDESSQPLEKRVASTKAPVRKAAYAELSDAFASATDDAPFEAHGAALPKMLADSAPACHEAALQAALAFACKAPPALIADNAAGAAKPLVEKHLSGRFYDMALDCLLGAAEAGALAAVQAALLKGAAHATPKVRAGAVKVLVELVRAAHAVDAKEVLAVVPGCVTHRDAKVRDEGMSLLAELKGLLGADRAVDGLKGVDETTKAKLREAAAAEPPLTRRRVRSADLPVDAVPVPVAGGAAAGEPDDGRGGDGGGGDGRRGGGARGREAAV